MTADVEAFGRQVAADNAAQSAFYETHDRTVEAGPDPLWGVFDDETCDFVAAFETQREAQDREADLEQQEHDYGRRPTFPTYFPRYSVDRLPSDHPLAEDWL